MVQVGRANGARSWVVIAALAVMFSGSFAQARTCAELGEDLQAMQTAQKTLLDSMVRKNDSMASTLDQYAQNFSTQKKVGTKDVVSLRKSANAFRNHQERESKLVARFQAKTQELLVQVNECLKTKTIAAQ